MKKKDWMAKEGVQKWEEEKWEEQREAGMQYQFRILQGPEQDFAIVKREFQGERLALGMPSSTIGDVLHRIQSLHDGLTLAQELRGSGLESKYLTVLESCDGECKMLAERDLDGFVAKLESLMSEIEKGTYVIEDLTQK